MQLVIRPFTNSIYPVHAFTHGIVFDCRESQAFFGLSVAVERIEVALGRGEGGV